MAYKNFTTQTMVTISGTWLDKAHERPLIESLPQAGALLSSVEKAHKGLLHTQLTGEKTDAELSAVQLESADEDTRHDRKARGLYYALTAFADLADDPDDTAAYLALRDRIFVHGLKVIQWSYADEAGEAKLVDERVTPADRALLKQLPMPGGKLMDAHTARVKAGNRLGELDRKRIALSSHTDGAQGATQGDVMRARNNWIRVVNAFVATLDLEENLSEASWERILGPLREAERRADRRGNATAASQGSESPGAGEAPENTSTEKSG
jgi:hypothetical protein